MTDALDFWWGLFLWLVVGFGVLAMIILWVIVIVASVVSVFRFIKEYKKAATELEKEEEGDGPPLHF